MKQKKLIAFFWYAHHTVLNKISLENALSSFYVNHDQRLTKAKQGKLSVLIYTFISFDFNAPIS
jgi:hypothetical protein